MKNISELDYPERDKIKTGRELAIRQWDPVPGIAEILRRRFGEYWRYLTLRAGMEFGSLGIDPSHSYDPSIDANLMLGIEKINSRSGAELFIVMAEPANNYALSNHSNKGRLQDAFGFVPLTDRPDHGILFQGYYGMLDRQSPLQIDGGRIFTLQPELSSALPPEMASRYDFQSKHTNTQAFYAHTYLPHMPGFVSNAELVLKA